MSNGNKGFPEILDNAIENPAFELLGGYHLFLRRLLIPIFLGIIFLFLGGYKWNLILSFTGFLFGFGAIFFILWAFVEYKQTTQSYLIMTAIAIIVGVIFACLCRSFSILSYILLGFLVGFFIAKF